MYAIHAAINLEKTAARIHRAILLEYVVVMLTQELIQVNNLYTLPLTI